MADMKHVHIECDPSQYRPELAQLDRIAIPKFAAKTPEKFRNYSTGDGERDLVKNTYLQMHTHQCVEFVREKMSKWCRFDKVKMSIMEALELLNEFVDESDPDTELPNIVHAFQTAERIREAHPNDDWFHLTGLIHDLGKIMAIFGEPQYCVVGDTFPVGCRFADSIVLRNETFDNNPDVTHELYSQPLGMYSPGTGLRNVIMSWGHDEYLFRVLSNHSAMKLPQEALYAIRFHSFYPWHTGGDYMALCDDEDLRLLPSIREFNKFDLYSKCPEKPDIDALKPYYQSLIDKYCPGKLDW